jgi:arylsulfatase
MKNLSLLTILLVAIVGTPVHVTAQEKPNIVIIFMDNFGWGEPGFNGGGITRGTETPQLDELANQGLRLTNFNVEVQCTPSRSALMTGRYAIRSGNGSVPWGEEYGLVQWEVTMAEMLSEAGYETAIYGKWHLGQSEGRLPTDQGFDEWYGIPNSSDEAVFSSLQEYNESGLSGEMFVMESKRGEAAKQIRPFRLDNRPLIDRELTDRAIGFMKREAADGNPFFLYLPYTATHFPTMPHPDFAGKTGNGVWADQLMQVDSYVGELLDTIDELDIRENTIVIFTADNGPEAGSYDTTNMSASPGVQGSPGPWRGGLFTGFEGALRVPFVARWPGKIPAGKSSDEIVHVMDLFPTLAGVAGGKIPDDRIIDGIDMRDFFLGKNPKSGREGFVVYMGNEIYGIKWRNWKLHFKEQDSALSAVRNYPAGRLYNLMTDPQEKNSVLFPHTWVLKPMLPLMMEHVQSLQQEPPIAPGTPDPYQPPK